MTTAYAQLSQRLADLTALEEVVGILSWDQEIVMPPGAAEARGKQLSTVQVVAHERLTDPRLAALLDGLRHDATLDATQAANVREAQRDVHKATRVPSELVRALGETAVRGHEVWVAARKHKDFRHFAPVLHELVDLAKRRAAAIAPDKLAYDVLLDDFEPGMTMAQLDPVFARLKEVLLPLIAKVRQAQNVPDMAWLTRHVPADAQREVGESIVRMMGYDFTRGRLDTSVHPFCGGAGPTDVRITTRYNEAAFLGSLTGMIHETGHALYEQGRDLSLADQPVSRPRSMGIHESQSLLWEKQVGQGAAFWQAHYPKLQKAYDFLREKPLAEFLFGVNFVNPQNLIRVSADELTYPLHVILRYELERELFSGRLDVDDLPAAWNQKMQGYLGIAPPDDAVGVLQDVHWSGGLFGYFPCYTLGALYAAQFYQAALAQHPEIPEKLSQGEVEPLLGWLRQNVHQVGSRLETDALVTAATGRVLDPEAFLAYVVAKYTKLYGLQP
jgi:carboxypeptidase Taq